MINKAFKRVLIYTSPSNGQQLIEWELYADYEPLTVDLLFYVEVRRASGSWTRLNNSLPIINNCFFWDESSYRFNIRDDIYYRIILVDGSRTFTSCETNIRGVWNEREWLIVRDIVRKEYLRLDKYEAGTPGWLLKRRLWGVRCTTCKEFDLQTSIRPNCPICYGTGIVYGYYDAVPYYMELQPGVFSAEDIQLPVGTISDVIYQAKSLAYPVLGAKDLWVAADTNDRYLIGVVKDIAELKSIPILYESIMAFLPPLAIEYTVPLSRSDEGSSSSS